MREEDSFGIPLVVEEDVKTKRGKSQPRFEVLRAPNICDAVHDVVFDHRFKACFIRFNADLDTDVLILAGILQDFEERLRILEEDFERRISDGR